jgi:hypothetical protein
VLLGATSPDRMHVLSWANHGTRPAADDRRGVKLHGCLAWARTGLAVQHSAANRVWYERGDVNGNSRLGCLSRYCHG